LVTYLGVADAPDCSKEFVAVVRPVAFLRLADMGILTTPRLAGTFLAPLCLSLDPHACEIMARCVDETLIHADVKPSKSAASAGGDTASFELESKSLATLELSSLVQGAARCVAFGYGFSELALPMFADLDVADATKAIRSVVKALKSTRPEALFTTILDVRLPFMPIFSRSISTRSNFRVCGNCTSCSTKTPTVCSVLPKSCGKWLFLRAKQIKVFRFLFCTCYRKGCLRCQRTSVPRCAYLFVCLHVCAGMFCVGWCM
jgi:hypothetical protein